MPCDHMQHPSTTTWTAGRVEEDAAELTLYARASPLQAIDDVTVSDFGIDVTLSATTDIDASDPHLRAHFPGFPIFPGVFILESLRQAVARAVPDGPPPDITAVRSLRFLAPLLAGDRMELMGTVHSSTDGSLRVTARAVRRDGTVAARLNVDFGRVEADQRPELASIRACLPHGHPMLLVDRVLALDPGRSISAIKAVTFTEPCFRTLPAGVPPGACAYPTALVLESFGQAAAILWCESSGRALRPDEIIVLGAARNCRIDGHAFPGDVMTHVARLDNVVGDSVIVEGETWVGDRRIGIVESMFAAIRERSALLEVSPAAATAGGGDGRP
jgi:3-hydroxymyristoyl/3-hydroxydecanoyl-(acyl carrier protein) dehydratase